MAHLVAAPQPGLSCQTRRGDRGAAGDTTHCVVLCYTVHNNWDRHMALVEAQIICRGGGFAGSRWRVRDGNNVLSGDTLVVVDQLVVAAVTLDWCCNLLQMPTVEGQCPWKDRSGPQKKFQEDEQHCLNPILSRDQAICVSKLKFNTISTRHWQTLNSRAQLAHLLVCKHWSLWLV